jgi:hypothetical protein
MAQQISDLVINLDVDSAHLQRAGRPNQRATDRNGG